MQRLLRVIAASVLTTAAVQVPGSSAVAVGDLSSYEVITDRLPSDKSDHVVVQLPAADLTAGDPVLLWASLGATSRTGMLQAARVRCDGPGMVEQASVWTTRNHEGAENGVDGVRAVSVVWLFDPPASGHWVCQLIGRAAKTGAPPDEWLDVAEGSLTYLKLTDQPGRDAEEWRLADDQHLRLAGTSPYPQEATIFSETWEADPGASQVRVFAGLQASVVSTGGQAPFVIEVTVTATTAGCAPVSTTVTQSISGLLHHYKIARNLTVPLNGCGHEVDIEVTAAYVPAPPGAPVRHGGVVHGIDGNGDIYTSMYAMSV